MSLNSSSSSDSTIHQNLHPTSAFQCFLIRPNSIIITPFFILRFLLIPLCIYIFHHGLQQWRKKRSTSTLMSHSDSFTYHMVFMELISSVGCIFGCWGIFSNQLNMFLVGFILFSFTWYGQVFFHVLTCVERYLAVVHPITYLSLRKERGIKIRNISNGCVWLLCFSGMSLVIMNNFNSMDICVLILCLAIVSFCSLSVLCVLIRPGPGEQGGGKERVDQSKQRAFYTIMAILGVLVLRFAGSLVRSVTQMLEGHPDCTLLSFEAWINLPSSLVLPLLFLIKAGKLASRKNNVQ